MCKRYKMALSKRRKDFCKFYAEGLSIPESAKEAGYAESYVKVSSHKLLDNCEIKKEIERLQDRVRKIADEKFDYSIEQAFANLEKAQELALKGVKRAYYDGKCIDELINPDLSAFIQAEKLKAQLQGLFEKDNTQRAQSVQVTINRKAVDVNNKNG